MPRILAMTLGVLATLSAHGQTELPFQVEPIAAFDEPWAMAFLPDWRMLVTEKQGTLFIVTRDEWRRIHSPAPFVGISATDRIAPGMTIIRLTRPPSAARRDRGLDP